MDVHDAGISTEVKSRQSENALSPIVVTDGIETEVKFQHLLNALSPIVVTDEDISIELFFPGQAMSVLMYLSYSTPSMDE